jgi:LmeA-like phospholipid-binding
LLCVAVPLSGAILLIGAYALLLPSFLGSLVAQELQGQLRLTEKPRVNLEGRWPGVLTGRFEGGRIALADPELGGVARFDELSVDLEPFDLDVLGGVTGGRIKSEESLSGDLGAALSEEEVARVATTSGSRVPVRNMELEEGRMVVGSEVEALGARIPIAVEGDLILRGGALRFEPGRVEVFGSPVTEGLARGGSRG